MDSTGTARLTLQSVSGHGLCLGTVPHTHRHLCNQTATVTCDDKYIVSPINSWWACSNGLTPCIYSNLLKNNQAIFCVLVQLIPRLTYYTEEQFSQTWDPKSDFRLLRTKRDPITAVTLAVLLGLGTTGAGVGITSLVLSNKYYSELRLSIDEDIEPPRIRYLPSTELLIIFGGSSPSKSKRVRSITPSTGRPLCRSKRRMLFLYRPLWRGQRFYGQSQRGFRKKAQTERTRTKLVPELVLYFPLANNSVTLHIRSLHRLVTPPVLWTLGIQEAN